MKKVCILFPDPHLPYSPTVLNLFHHLKRYNEVTVLTFQDKQFGRVNEKGIMYLPISWWLRKIYGGVNKYSLVAGFQCLSIFKKWSVHKFLKQTSFDHLIATDPISLWMLPAACPTPIHLLSLELTRNTTMYLPKVNLQRIHSLIIQSEERKNILAPNFKGKVFFLQNAPVFNPEMLKKESPKANQLLFSGTAFKRFGVMHCIDFMQSNPAYHLTIIGKVPDLENELIHKKYSQLINEKRLLIETNYFSTNDLIVEMGKYRIGFCFYDFSFPEIDNDNYKTAPSGKMFAYFAAGVPIIGIKIPGLLPIATFNAGVLIDEITTDAIEKALQQIEANYNEMVNGCYKAAKHYSFDSAVQPILTFLSDHH